MAPTSSESSGTGDPARTIALLWGTSTPARRGPRPALTTERVVGAAVTIADDEGDLAALSMRRVAEALGVSTMSLYTYVASRTELVEAMLDTVLAEQLAELAALTEGEGPTDWQAGLLGVAEASWSLSLRHPWVLEVFTGRPPLGPNAIAAYDLELRVLEGIGLTDVEMDAALTVLHTHVEGVARRRVEAARTVRRTGLTDAQWWASAGPALAAVLDPDRFPVASRVGTAAGETHQSAHDPEDAYRFGVRCLVDGLAVLVGSRTSRS